MTGTARKTKTLPSNEALRAEAETFYKKERKALGGSAPILPAKAKVALAAKYGVEAAKLASSVDPVYFRNNGTANPLPLPAKATPRSLATAVRKRRDAGTTLGRWESVAASAAVALGRPVSEAAVRSLYAKGGGNIDASYTGRGTRKAAPATRSDASAEVEVAS